MISETGIVSRCAFAAIGSMLRTASTPAAIVFFVPPVSWIVIVRKTSLSWMP